MYVSSLGQTDTLATQDGSALLSLGLKGDFDDGRLGLMDFFTIADAVGRGAAADELAGSDLDEDGILSAGDIQVLLQHWRQK